MSRIQNSFDLDSHTLNSATALLPILGSSYPKEKELSSYHDKGLRFLKSLRKVRNNQGVLILEGNGIDVEITDPIELRKALIKDYFLFEGRKYLRSLTKGPFVFRNLLSNSFNQCLEELGLYEDENYEWWDELKQYAYSDQDHNNLITGRKAEKKSIEYEEKRLGLPIRKSVSIKDDTQGYDLFSYVDKKNKFDQSIEVKGSESSISRAFFFLTKNEWNYSKKTICNHVFHLWDLPNRQLAILSIRDIETHIPLNNGKGVWQNVKIPFSLFKKKFKKIN